MEYVSDAANGRDWDAIDYRAAWDDVRSQRDDLIAQRDSARREAIALRAENKQLRDAARDCVTEIQELMAGTTLLSWSVPQALAALKDLK